MIPAPRFAPPLVRTLILSYGLGTGHKCVGDLLQAELAARGHACAHRPLEDWVPWDYDLLFRKGYLLLAVRLPRIWDAMYRSPRFASKEALAFWPLRGRAVRRFEREGLGDFDLVVATQYNAMEVAADWKGSAGGAGPKLAVVLTDYDIYPLWARREVDLFLVPDEALKGMLVERGVRAEKVLVTGIPVAPAFEREENGAGVRRELGLPEEAPCVLVFGGGGGFGPLDRAVRAALRTRDAAVIAVCGHNRRLRRGMIPLAQAHPERLRVLGYRRDMPRLMAASDVIITKGGGLSLTEALYSGKRTIAIPGLLGQERANLEFMERRGWVEVCRELEDLPSLVARGGVAAPRQALPPQPARRAADALDAFARAS
jgi:processive 1,2-diacylglycerol beta-glucosyltransferase